MIGRCFRPSLILLHSVHNNATAFLPVPIKIAHVPTVSAAVYAVGVFKRTPLFDL